MNHEDTIYCFSALTWNLELLCTLSFSTKAPREDAVRHSCHREEGDEEHSSTSADSIFVFPSMDAYLHFVSEFLAKFEQHMILHIRARHGDGLSDTERATEQSLLSYLQCHFAQFRWHTSRALKDGDVKRRSAQHIARGIYLSGKYPAVQPLLLEYLGIDRVFQVYAGNELDRMAPASIGALAWTPLHASFSPLLSQGHVFTSVLPVSKRRIVKLVIPVVDDEAYDLMPHFHDDIFGFMDGRLPLPGIDDRPTGGVCRTLVHCSAGMHRSATFVVAYLLRESVLAGEPVNPDTGRSNTVEDWCAFVRSRRSVAMPTDFAKRSLELLHQALHSQHPAVQPSVVEQTTTSTTRAVGDVQISPHLKGIPQVVSGSAAPSYRVVTLHKPSSHATALGWGDESATLGGVHIATQPKQSQLIPVVKLGAWSKPSLAVHSASSTSSETATAVAMHHRTPCSPVR